MTKRFERVGKAKPKRLERCYSLKLLAWIRSCYFWCWVQRRKNFWKSFWLVCLVVLGFRLFSNSKFPPLMGYQNFEQIPANFFYMLCVKCIILQVYVQKCLLFVNKCLQPKSYWNNMWVFFVSLILFPFTVSFPLYPNCVFSTLKPGHSYVGFVHGCGQ